ncbi:MULTISPECIES: hypothetical protein [unclassified Halomonas]|uniref:hypothetical protein n=1 Tax=Halomonadaceae TaxID=28256 RepID=UPI00022D2694|nr:MULTISPECIES: hypothetical protein [unclassified Halomonas]EHA17185.1 hypothetical protein HAL1_02530 [Halomonas sp. HAL1]PKG48948.1 hypothetical protein CXF87_15030 [Halomonas sp. MES3-P3E]WKV94678.1 hypothetical protein Q3Y66_08655 [Halomonas sp. HAL1]
MHKILTFCWLGIMTTVAASAYAEEDDSDLPVWAEEHVEPFRESVGNWVDNTSRRIDGFFGTDDHMQTKNESYLRFGQEIDWMEGDGTRGDTSLRYRIDLPTSEERLRLVIESDPEESQGTLEEQGSGRLANDQRDRRSSTLGLDWLESRDKRENWSNRVGAGIRLRLPLDPYVRFTSERLWQLGEGPWQLESNNRVSWFNNEGYSARTRWDIGRQLSERRHLRFISTVQWREEEDKLEYSEIAEINHRINRRSALRYSAIAIGESASNPRMTNYYLQTRYRRDIHKGILFADVIPELHFQRDVSYDPRWAMTLRLEMYFQREISRDYF